MKSFKQYMTEQKSLKKYVEEAEKIARTLYKNNMDVYVDSDYEFNIGTSDPEVFNPTKQQVTAVANKIKSKLKGSRVTVHETKYNSSMNSVTIAVSIPELM